MSDDFVVDVYLTAKGLLVESQQVEGVENAFAPGSVCDLRYCDMLDAYTRICKRLGTANEDPDVEIIVNALLDIEWELCFRMFEYGRKYAELIGRA